MADTIATARLLLRRARPDDIEAMHAILSDPVAMRYWSTPRHQHVSETEQWLQSMISDPEGERDDFIVERDGRVIGKLGAWRLPEVGYLFAQAQWGRGYASEALRAYIAHRRGRSAELTADTDPRNLASIRLLQRHGFVETGRAERTWLVAGEWCDSIYWRLDL